LGDRKGIQPLRKLGVGLLMVTFDWSCAHLLAPVSSNKIQSGDIMVPVTQVHVENGRQNGEGERERC